MIKTYKVFALSLAIIFLSLSCLTPSGSYSSKKLVNLHKAVWSGDLESVTAHIDRGSNLNAVQEDGYTPLHFAAYKNYPGIASALLEAGADVNILANSTTPFMWAASKGSSETAVVLMEYGADENLAGENRSSAMDYYIDQFGDDISWFYKIYNNSVIIALLEDSEAVDVGTPSLPPYAEAELELESSYNYLDGGRVKLTVTNSGKGDLYQVAGTVSINDKSQILFPGTGSVPRLARKTFKEENSQMLYFGKVRPSESVSRVLNYKNMTISDSGDLPLSVTFSEANDYNPDPLQGKISVVAPDSNFVIDNISRMDIKDLKYSIVNGYITSNDLNRAVILRGSDMPMKQIKDLVSNKLIDRTVIDKLIRFEKIDYTIDDILFFAKNRAITQENLELVLIEKRVNFTASDVISIAKENYVSKQIVEFLYSDGLAFTSSQIRVLISMDIFSLPEILYTYTITDGDSDNSVGNRDGMIQIKEGVDFNIIIKNNSVFDISGMNISVGSGADNIALFNGKTSGLSIKSGKTIEVVPTISVKPAFRGDNFKLSVSIDDSYFGELIREERVIPVGRTVGSKVLTLNKKVAANRNIIVRSGASGESSQLASLSEGAVFDAVGELGEWYKVGIYGKFGWINKSQVNDYTQKTDSTFLVENRADFAVGEDSEEYSKRLFVNSRPTVLIVSPKNNDDVYNRTEMEILAVDPGFGIQSVDIRINGKPIEGSEVGRGLRVANKTGDEYQKTFMLPLRKGENKVSVTAYNGRNIASDTKEIVLWSQGVQNPPSLYALAVGVSDYKTSGQDLNYAASDAEKIASVFKNQTGSEIYEKVEVKTLTDSEATRANIKDGINNFLSNARADDVAILFFAGHGITDSRGNYYLLGYDGDISNPSANGLKQSDFVEDLQASVQARKVLVMLDSCQSGSVTTGTRGNNDITKVVDDLTEATGFTIMSAARGNEFAYEDENWDGGAFTMAIEEALKSNKADTNSDGFVDVNEMDSFVYDKVVELTDSKQHPTKMSASAESYKFYQALK